MSANLGWLFYKDYFKDINYASLESQSNETLIQHKIKKLIEASALEIPENEMLGNMHFKATTSYPGLILGSGNTHELPDIKGQAILGFSFDYTSGLPVIAGSSIKGVLRSAFKHKEYIEELTECKEVEALEKEIFDNGDIFFDASIVKSIGSNILGDDYLTPHGDDPLKNPIPLRFIKVMPNVTFRFDFELKSGILSKHEKAELFRAILQDLGLGAKTNVGYGKFVDFAKEQTKEERENEKKEREDELFDKAVKANCIETLTKFKQTYPNSSKITEVDEAIEKLKEEQEKEHIRTAFSNLDRTKKNHVDGFINKYKDNSLAEEFIAQLCASEKTTPAAMKADISALNEAKETRKFKQILMQIGNIDASEYPSVKKAVLKLCNTLNSKGKKKFFKEVKLARFTSTDLEAEIKAELGLQ